MSHEVVLVPRRGDNGYRDAVWADCKQIWEREQSHMPIFEGHHDTGLFNRSAAINRAAALASDWDIAVIIDADVIIDPGRVKEACVIAAETGKVVYPHDIRHQLNRRGSELIRQGYRGPWEPYAHAHYDQMVSSVVVVPRKLWDEIGGFDESFEGWGFEDTAFAAAAETFGPGTIRMPGEFWHLWHPTAKEGKPGTPAWSLNSAKGQRYRAAIGNVEAIRALQAEPRGAPSPERGSTTIPKILHRVVPAQTPEIAERWWTEFGALHPDWTLMTWRDPLSGVEWPRTYRHWSRCTSGAQLAGLIRLEALLRWGGIYVDQDMQPFRSLDPLLSLQAFAAWEDDKVIPDAVLGAMPGHPAIAQCLDLALKRLGKGPWASGPGVTTEILQGRTDVLVLPPESFFPVHYRNPDRDALMAGFDASEHPATFAVHQYWGSWLEESRRRVPA